MEALSLDPGSYAGTYKLVGGRPSLDLVNTVSWAGADREHDWFDPGANVIRWARALDLITEPVAEQMLAGPTGRGSRVAGIRRVRRVRATLIDVLRPLVANETPPPPDVEALNAYIVDAHRRRFIEPGSLTWAWREPVTLDHLMDPVVLDAGALITGPDRPRVKECPGCGWLFLDGSRNRSRRWCDMADCGSRDKARRYYHRQRNSGA